MDIDIKAREVRFMLDLKGERELVEAIVKGLSSSKKRGRYFVSFESFEISREWINRLAQNYLPEVMKDNWVEVPELLGKALMGLNIV